jgi:sterol desaturase/sphingolipid hydroxylase (fatty acid hydroxylase superfamily)
MVHWFESWFAEAQRWLFESAVQPLVYSLGLMTYHEQAFDATEWFLLGVIEVIVLALVLGALQRWFPVEPVTDRATVRTDIFYTLLHRLGIFPLIVFAIFTPLLDGLEGWLRLLGLSRMNLEQMLPGLAHQPIVSFLIYLVVLDFADYWLHRGQHRFHWWWQLHALHHSQRQMTFWSDNRNHLLDDLIRDVLFALLAMIIGVAPSQFVALLIASRVLQSVQHANLRWHFGTVGEWLLVSPSFHRLHHAIGYGHEGRTHGCNFAVLLPIWDRVFGTADFRRGFVPTGIRDQLQGRNYGHGFWSQQWLALRRIVGRTQT